MRLTRRSPLWEDGRSARQIGPEQREQLRRRFKEDCAGFRCSLRERKEPEELDRLTQTLLVANEQAPAGNARAIPGGEAKSQRRKANSATRRRAE